MPNGNHMFRYCTIDCWKDVVDLALLFDSHRDQRWLFRGQSNHGHGLSTSLERFHNQLFQCGRNISTTECERESYDQFVRQAQYYITDLPPRDEEWLLWLSHMQHHGAPTRLLDFTRSFLIAVYFALESANINNNANCSYAAVWAVNQKILDKAFLDTIPCVESGHSARSDRQAFEKMSYANQIVYKSVREGPICKPLGVIVAKPWVLNQRIAAQRGHFLVPLVIEHSFEENLCHSLQVKDDDGKQAIQIPSKPVVEGLNNGYNNETMRTFMTRYSSDIALLKILMRYDMFCDALEGLNGFNISHNTLFPGLDDYSRGIRSVLCEKPPTPDNA